MGKGLLSSGLQDLDLDLILCTLLKIYVLLCKKPFFPSKPSKSRRPNPEELSLNPKP